MRRAILSGSLVLACLAIAPVVHAEHRNVPQLRSQLEVNAALLDSHTRRLYYEIRNEAEGNNEHEQLLSDARELWRAARSLNDRALDGGPSSRLERDARRVEKAFHEVEERFQELRQSRVDVPTLRKRLNRIDYLVHETHDSVHELLDLETAAPNTQSVLRRPSPAGNNGYYPADPLPRVPEVERRAVEVVDPPAVRIGPDGFYFDGRRFTIPLGR